MDPQVRTSFIPKKPITAAPARRRGGLGLILFITILVFLVSIVAAGGVYAYEQYLKKAIVSKSESLSRARAAYEPAVIEELIRLNQRLKLAQQVLDSHIAPSAVFKLLEDVTLQNVRYRSFEFSTDGQGGATLALNGEARAFTDVALQSDAFASVRSLKDLIFRDINLEATGRVIFSIGANVEASHLRYSSSIAIPSETTETTTP